MYLFARLPDEVQQLLATPPVTDKKLLELSVAWTGLAPGHARMADALRLFVITWDPVEGIAQRPDGFATVNSGSLGLELVVYAPMWSLVERATERDRLVVDELGAMAGSAVMIAAEHEEAVTSGRYPGLVIQQSAPDLLSGLAAGSELGQADVRGVSPGWEDIGLGAITDAVQHAFGPVDLDRSPVELATSAKSRPGCPACIDRRFDFPADLASAQDDMCPAHRNEAETVIRRRIARANASNPDGWGALTDASGRRERPHLPNGLATKLAGADEPMYVVSDPGELAKRAHLVIEAASWFPGRADDLATALGQEDELTGQFPDWLVNIVLDLGHAGLGTEAAKVGDALARVEPDNQRFYDGDVPVALAESGFADEARARIAANLGHWPGDFWILIHAGDALAALDDIEGAEVHFGTAVEVAERTDDFEARHDAVERLRQIGPRDERVQPSKERRQPRRKQSRSNRKRGR